MTGGTMWICSAVILLLTWEAEAFPTGAPNYVCGGMRPTHPGVQQPDDTLPYGIVLTSRTTMPGDVVTATVTVNNVDVPVNGQTMRINFFKGIMSTVVDAQNMRIPGFVQPPPDSNLQILNCTSTQGEVPDTAITHRDGTQWEFNSKSFDFRIPQNIPIGTELTMRFTIVYNTSIYWVAIPRTFTVGTPMMPMTQMTPRPPTTGTAPVTPMPPTMPTSRPTGPVQPTGPGAQPTTGNNVGTTGLVSSTNSGSSAARPSGTSLNSGASTNTNASSATTSTSNANAAAVAVATNTASGTNPTRTQSNTGNNVGAIAGSPSSTGSGTSTNNVMTSAAPFEIAGAAEDAPVTGNSVTARPVASTQSPSFMIRTLSNNAGRMNSNINNHNPSNVQMSALARWMSAWFGR